MSFTRVILPQTVDSLRDVVQPAPWLLVAKSLLMQWAVGLLCVERLFLLGFSLLDEEGLWSAFRRAAVLLAFVLGSIGMAVGELSRLRDIIHSRTSWPESPSWSSREKLTFGLWLLVTGAYVILLCDSPGFRYPEANTERCGWLSAAMGIAGLICSGMVLVETRQKNWSAPRVLTQFGYSTLLLALTSGLVALNLARINHLELRHSSIATLLACLLLDAIAIISSTRLFNSRRASFTAQPKVPARCDYENDNDPQRAGAFGWAVNEQLPTRSGVFKVRTSLGWLSAIVVTLLVASQKSLSALQMTDKSALLLTILIGCGIVVRLTAEALERYLFLLPNAPATVECGDLSPHFKAGELRSSRTRESSVPYHA